MTTFPSTLDEFLNGQVFLLNKPIGWSSFDIVKKMKYLIRKKYFIKKIKIGHAGTLDPLATGLLIICTGKFTKKISEIQNLEKTYTGTIQLGGSTPSYDLETEVFKNYKTNHITEKLITQKAKDFVGLIKQKPPIYSALKKGGERLYEKARRGENVTIDSRLVFVREFKIVSIENLKVHFKIICSKGTYIRSLAHDIGKSLNIGAWLFKLQRTKIGEHNLKNSFEIHQFEEWMKS